MTHMDDRTNQAPEQSGMPDNEEYSSYTLPTEDAAAQEAHTIPLEDAAAQESRTIPLEDERTQGAQDSAAQPAKKKSPLPWIIGAIMGKKVGDKYIRRSYEMEDIDDADWNKPHP